MNPFVKQRAKVFSKQLLTKARVKKLLKRMQANDAFRARMTTTPSYAKEILRRVAVEDRDTLDALIVEIYRAAWEAATAYRNECAQEDAARDNWKAKQ